MYSRNYGIESDGDLYKMQQEAIKRAREMSRQSSFQQYAPPMQEEHRIDSVKQETYEDKSPIQPFGDSMQNIPEPAEPVMAPPAPAAEKKGGLFDFFKGGSLSSIFKKFKTDDILLLFLLIMLISEESDDDIILLVAFVFFSGML